MKIAIVGTAAGEMDAPFKDEEYEIWCLNWMAEKYPRVTRDFEIHQLRNEKTVIPKKHNHPTITQENFPHQYIEENFPRYLSDNFYKSSIDYMMAYAIYTHLQVEAVEKVEIHGVFMAIDNDEYFRQQPSLHAWVGYALNMFDVEINKKSPLMRSDYVYGVTPGTGVDPLFNSNQFEVLEKEHVTAMNQAQEQINHLEEVIHTHSGCVQAYKRLSAIDRARESGQIIRSLQDTAKVIV